MSGRNHDTARAGRGTCGPVVITGFMAAGKTAVARALARLLGCEMADTDELVRAREGRTPAEIIDAEGEARFREIESRALRDALARPVALVVALGGGAWAAPANRELIAGRGCHTVWLDAPFELCWRRIEAESAKLGRPLGRDMAGARALFDARRELYALAAHRVEITAGRAAEAVAAEIAKLLGGFQHSGQRRDETGEG
jgi:shikimate kinase